MTKRNRENTYKHKERANRKEREGLFGVHESRITAVTRGNWAKENLGWTSRESLLTLKPVRLPNGLSGEEVWAPLPRSFKTSLDRSTQGNIVGNKPALAEESQHDLPFLVLSLIFVIYNIILLHRLQMGCSLGWGYNESGLLSMQCTPGEPCSGPTCKPQLINQQLLKLFRASLA